MHIAGTTAAFIARQLPSFSSGFQVKYANKVYLSKVTLLYSKFISKSLKNQRRNNNFFANCLIC